MAGLKTPTLGASAALGGMQAATQPITRKTTTNRDQNVSPSNVLPNTQNSVNTKVNSGNVAPMTPIPQQPKIDYKLQDMDAKLSQLKSNVFSLSNIPAGFNKPGQISGITTPAVKRVPGTSISVMPSEVQQGIQQDVKIANQRADLSQSLADFAADIKKNGDITADEIQQYYPELVGQEQSLADLAKDVKQNGDITREELIKYYPEFNIPMNMSDVQGKNPILRAGGAILGGIQGTTRGFAEGVESRRQPMVDDIKRIRADDTKSFPEKLLQIGFGEIVAKYGGGVVGDTIGGLMSGSFKGFTTESERQYLGQKAKNVLRDMVDVAKTNPDMVTLENKYNSLDDKQKQELNDYMGYAINALNYVGVEAAFNPVKNGMKDILEIGIKGLDKTVGPITDKMGSKAISLLKDMQAGIKTKTGPLADKILQKANGITIAEAKKYNLKHGELPGTTLNNAGIVQPGDESLASSLEQMHNAQLEKKKGLEAITTKVPKDEKVTQMAQEVANYEKKTALPGDESNPNSDVNKYNGLVEKARNGTLSHTEFEDIKATYERKQSLKYDALKTSAEADRQKKLDSYVRVFQQQTAADAGFNNIKDINKNISKWKALSDILTKAQGRADAKIGGLGLTDYILLGGAIIKPIELPLLVGKKVAETSWFKRNIVSLLNKINGRVNVVDQIADIKAIKNINSEAELLNFIKEGSSNKQAIEQSLNTTETPNIIKNLQTGKPIYEPRTPIGKQLQSLANNKEGNVTMSSTTTNNMSNDIGTTKLKGKGLQPKNESISKSKVTVEEPLYAEARKYKSAEEALQSPEMQEKYRIANKKMNKGKVTKTSNNLYHTTSAENLDSIMKEGLKPGKTQRFEGVGSKNTISFGANEQTAQYYGKEGDVMIRTKAGYKPQTLDIDLIAGGEGAYTVSETIPPNMLEIKKGNKWISLEEYKKSNPLKQIREEANKGSEGLQPVKKGLQSKNEVLNVVNNNKRIEIFKNITSSQEREIKKIAIQDYGRDVIGEHMRTTYDSKGNSYSWYSDNGTHGDIQKILQDKGIETNQTQGWRKFNKKKK